ncbi:universal stress protein [Aquimarina brevivitae]|uniref:Nucleotide-binding universal stress UspA family protein n=1 Tax=Aquimarina brevivitae TaxID=323412 RepID=A0A4Q7PGR3_9FLAO|nr:universal stress protein [Aquimarina brevivitae]RZS99711.1 nucleotide-binding universal stress UspA family protein [Aquimarina brevivitae]
MKNILLPTDFSKNSINAIHYALKLYDNELCTFYLLHVQKASEYITDDLMTAKVGTSVHDGIVNKPQEELEKLAQKLKGIFNTDNFSFELIVDYDSFTASVQQVITAKEIDLIIMGTDGATNAKEKIFGSNTLQVLRNIDCPVLVIPENYKYQNINSIAFVMDDQVRLSKEKLTAFLGILKKNNPKINILNIKEEDSISLPVQNQKNKLDSILEGYEVAFHTLTNIPTAIAINSFVQIKNVDLTATFAKPTPFLERFLKGSELATISYKTTVPLLLMPQ